MSRDKKAMEIAVMRARNHAREALQEQSMHEPKEFTEDQKLAYRMELYKWADKVVGYDTNS
ncbi:hypothetical protein RUK84_002918 [Vibrio cholerae]|uniref:hypothetical protein n=1 Tax=Vibrio fluvialis TaxID=676 RepID=UPI001EEC7AA2|nr:hypothetical protein [Vibrio fluvialis]ELJ8641949.1 hypothetical protein [Vibrio cholerae]MCG6346719.1 hypothetical protein [Vibrio fluvialis]